MARVDNDALVSDQRCHISNSLKIPSFLICVPVRIHAYEYASKPDGSQTALKLPLILTNTTKSSTRMNILS